MNARSLVIRFVFLAALTFPFSASANMRAPVEIDQDVVESIAPEGTIDDVSLTGERLTIRFPRLKVKEFGHHRATVRAEYTLRNEGGARTLPLVFFATDISEPRVILDGMEQPSPKLEEMTGEQRREFWTKVERSGGEFALRNRTQRLASHLEVTGVTATFQVDLEPGENVIAFEYQQSVAFYENDSRYGGPTHEYSQMALDYLLYPAKAWTMDPEFELGVRVVVPDYVHDGWLWDTHYVPETTIDPELKPTYDEGRHVTTFMGTFQRFPSDVLQVKIERGEAR